MSNISDIISQNNNNVCTLFDICDNLANKESSPTLLKIRLQLSHSLLVHTQKLVVLLVGLAIWISDWRCCFATNLSGWCDKCNHIFICKHMGFFEQYEKVLILKHDCNESSLIWWLNLMYLGNCWRLLYGVYFVCLGNIQNSWCMRRYCVSLFTFVYVTDAVISWWLTNDFSVVIFRFMSGPSSPSGSKNISQGLCSHHNCHE